MIKARQVTWPAYTTWSPMLPLLIAWLVSINEYYWSMIEVESVFTTLYQQQYDKGKARSSALPIPPGRPCCLHQLSGKLININVQ